MITRILIILGIAALAAPAPSVAAKNPKGCSRSGARPANPQGSVLVQTTTISTAAAKSAPAMVFGKSQGATGTATVVPDISAENAPKVSTSQPRPTAPATPKRRKPKRTASLSVAVMPAYSSC